MYHNGELHIMDNQHQKIKGYRDLSQEEIDLMNSIKDAGARLMLLQSTLAAKIGDDWRELSQAANEAGPESDEMKRLAQFIAAEPGRWAAIGKTDIQTGLMALVRAVAQPTL